MLSRMSLRPPMSPGPADCSGAGLGGEHLEVQHRRIADVADVHQRLAVDGKLHGVEFGVEVRAEEIVVRPTTPPYVNRSSVKALVFWRGSVST
jgi:hypothetical protein